MSSQNMSPPHVQRKRKVAPDHDDKQLNKIARRIIFDSAEYYALKKISTVVYDLIRTKDIKGLSDFIDTTFNTENIRIIMANNVCELINLEDIGLCMKIFSVKNDYIDSYYQSIFNECSLDFIDKLIDLDILNLHRIEKEQNYEFKYIINSIWLSGTSFKPNVGLYLLKKFPNLITPTYMIEYVIKTGMLQCFYNYISTKLINIISPDVRENNSNTMSFDDFVNNFGMYKQTYYLFNFKKLVNSIVMINFKHRVIIPSFDRFETLFDELTNYRSIYILTKYTNILSNLLRKLYDAINCQTLEYLTVRMRQVNAYNIISNAWFFAMQDPVYVYGRLKRLEEFIDLFEEHDVHPDITKLIMQRKVVPIGKERHQTLTQVMSLIRQHVPFPDAK
jgi:hypothetical protein